jgi:hypothetical protein
MTREFSPKSDYLGFHSDCADELMRQHDKRWFTVSIAYALAEMTSAHPSTEEVAGARRFIRTLINLPQATTEIAQFPKRELPTFES